VNISTKLRRNSKILYGRKLGLLGDPFMKKTELENSCYSPFKIINKVIYFVI